MFNSSVEYQCDQCQSGSYGSPSSLCLLYYSFYQVPFSVSGGTCARLINSELRHIALTVRPPPHPVNRGRDLPCHGCADGEGRRREGGGGGALVNEALLSTATGAVVLLK